MRAEVPDAARGIYCAGRLTIGIGGAITSRHYVDLNGDVTIGRMTIVAGVRSTLLTHSIDLGKSCQRVSKITIGDYVFVGTNSVILSGASIPDQSVIAAGSLVRGVLSSSWSLYGGVPARWLRSVDHSSKYFTRSDPYVEWGEEV